jgi:hypothetical protein
MEGVVTSKFDRKAEWEFKLENWRASGLSGAAWCRENDINYPVFMYWRRRIEVPTQKEVSTFVELTSPLNQTTGIDVEYRGVTLHLSKDFDATTFQRCLQLLKGC